MAEITIPDELAARLEQAASLENKSAASLIDECISNSRLYHQTRELLDLSQDMLCVISLDGHIVRVNRAAEHTLGYSSDQLLSKPLTDFAHQDDHAAIQDGLEVLRRGASSSRFEARFLQRDGSYVRLSWTAEPASEEGLAYAIASRVTEPMEAETYYQPFFEHILDAVLIADDEGHYVDANPAACQLTGYSKEALLGKIASDIAPPEFAPEFHTVWQQFLEQGEMQGEFIVQRRDGSVRYADFKAKAHFLPGRHLSILRDVTERRQAQSDYTDISETIQRLMQTTPYMVYIFDMGQQKTVFANDYLLDFYDVTLDQLQEGGIELLASWMHPDDLHTLEKFASQWTGATDDQIFSQDYRMRRSDGEYRWLRSRDMVFRRHEDGTIKSILGTSLDITDLKEIQVALAESEARLRNVFENSMEGLLLADEDGRIVEANPAAASMFRYLRQDIIKLTRDDLHPPDDLDYLETKEALASGQSVRRPLTYKRKDETTFIGEVTAVPFIHQHDRQWYSVMIRDISESLQAEEALRASEKRFRTLFEGIADTILVHDEEANLLDVNESACQRLGYSREELLQMKTTDIDSPEYAAGFKGRLAVQLTEGELSNADGVHITKDGRELYIDANSKVIDYYGKAAVLAVCRDVTQRKQAELEIRRLNAELEQRVKERTAELERANQLLASSERRFANIINLAADAIISVDEKGQITLFNQGAEEIFGYAQQEILGQSMNDLIPEAFHDSHRRHFDDFAQVTDTNRRIKESSNVSGRRKNGEVFPAQSSVSKINTEDGLILTVIMRDITEQKAANEALQISEARYRGIVETQTELVSRFGASDFVMTFVNDACARYFGLGIDGLVGHSVLERIPEDERQTALEAFQSVVSNRQVVVRENQVILADGSQRWIRWTNQPIVNAEDEVIEIQSVGVDITEIREAEELLREERDLLQSIMDTSHTGITVVEANGQISFANRRSEEILGLTRSEITDRTYDAPAWRHTDMDGGPWPDEKQPFVRVMKTRTPVYDVRHAIEDGKGRRIYLSINGTPLFDPSGEINRIVFTIEDISLRKLWEAQMRYALTRERELKEMKSHVVSMVSHEFGNPLTVIMTSATLLRRQYQTLTEQEIQSRFDAIERQVMRISSLIDAMRFLNKADLLGHQLELVSLDIAPLLAVLVNEIILAYGDSIPIQRSVAASCGRFNLDEVYFHQIVVNLLSNAVKYSKPGGTVTLTCRCDDDALTLVVQDEGIGIPEKDQSRLFEIFHRADNVGSIQGTGLGLAIVKQAVDAHHGAVTFESEEGRGTTVTVTIPRLGESVLTGEAS